ncbi:MAG: aminopeptidase P family protein [SAR202 cluster bacterium]|jgi:Xaa-Pro aminopeptidase|nr:aminopeptidase P family protein [SAR202 cluster bacterium]MDP6513277.1 aminopeptidase P family protein [SAR202 cluster bacterium]MDP6715868.1 aminopeptidase P family protein [SAR202 cluster bacterium]
MNVSSRIENLRRQLSAHDVDAMLISMPENRRYLSGFTGSAGYLLVSESDAILATDFRYIEQGGQQAPDYRIYRIGGGSGWLSDLSSELDLSKIGYESDHLTVAGLTDFEKALTEDAEDGVPKLVSTTGIVESMRAVKDENERDLLEKAVALADEALGRVAPAIEPGMTEQQVAWDIEKAMRELGAESIAFDIIVGAGPNGALPHHKADDTVIQPGDPVVIDMGATYAGYRSDLTRTFCIGPPDDRFTEIYDTVLGAQIAAEEAVRPGMTGAEVDAVARDYISNAGYEEYFGHGLGHGVGLAVHERPRVVQKSEDVLEDGMIFTIEPGIYIPGWGGVRIEDIVSLENGRARVLSQSPK